MTIARLTTRTLPLASAAALLQTGCANLQTRPGTPDSYRTGLVGGGYYAPGGLHEAEWPTSRQAAQAADVANNNDTDPATTAARRRASEPPPPQYLATDVPTEIWQARGATWNLHLKYLAASFKAGDVQDAIALPLFGAAVATAALGIAKASTVAVAAAGLAGGSVAAGYSYAHPDTDRDADQTAAFSLVCIVDSSLPLRTLSVVPLLLDKAALQDAVDALTIQAGTGASSGQAATTKAMDAAQKTMTQLDDNINAFNNMPSVIYTAKDAIDSAAQTRGVRKIDYASILSSLEGAASTKTGTAQAKETADTAKQVAAAVPKTRTSTSPMEMTHLDNITTDAGKGSDTKGQPIRTALSDPADVSKTVSGAAGSDQTTTMARIDTLASENLTAAQKVAVIAGDATEDLAVRNYSIIATNIKSCAATGQPALPLTMPASTPTTAQAAN